MGSKPKPATQSSSSSSSGTSTTDQTVDSSNWMEQLQQILTSATSQQNSQQNSTGTQQQVGSQNQNTTSSWNPALNPFVGQMLGSATQALGATPTSYNGQLYAEPNDMQTRGVQALNDVAGSLGQGSQEVRNLALSTIAGDYLSPDSNPFIRGAVDAAIRPVTEQLNRQIIPGIGDASQAGGAYGGDRQGVMQGIAAGDWAQAAGDIGSTMYFNNYNAERDRQMQAPSLLTQANSMALAPAQALLTGGGMQQGWAQGQLDANRQGFVNSQMDPWSGVQNYQNILQGLMGFGTTSSTGQNVNTGTSTGATTGQVTGSQQGSQTGTTSGTGGGIQHQVGTGTTTQQGTSTGTQTMPGQSGIGSLFSGALGGASAGSAFGPWGAGIGGILGGLGGLFG